MGLSHFYILPLTIQPSKNGNFYGSWFAGKVNLNYLNKYCTDLDDFVCVGTMWTRQTGLYKTSNKSINFEPETVEKW